MQPLYNALLFFHKELNAIEPVKRAGTQCSNSNSNLPSVPGGRANGVGRVASWAVSFERLLEDPLGVHYFTVSPRPPIISLIYLESRLKTLTKHGALLACSNLATKYRKLQ